MSVLNEIFGSGFDIYKFLTQKSKANNISKRLLFRELKNNIERLEHRNKKGVDRNILIEKLENESVLKAIQDGYDFNKLAPKSFVDDSLIDVFRKAKRYKGWSAEQVVFSIDEKITVLRDLVAMFPDFKESNLNLTSRLNNLYFQCILLVILIRKSAHE
jgi:hypothetical protein